MRETPMNRLELWRVGTHPDVGYCAGSNMFAQDVNALMAENAKLREALTEIAKCDRLTTTQILGRTAYRQVCELAREALATPEGAPREPPYPFCFASMRDKCIAAGRCMRDPCCAD